MALHSVDLPNRVGPPAHGGELVREWRQRRRRSQMDLALNAGVSVRHLSFVETGRARPSRRLLVALADELDVPLREQNLLMLAAGYAPSHPQSELGAEEAGAARAALKSLLVGHEPFPAVILDRCGDIVLANRATAALLEGCAPHLLRSPQNVYRLSLHPEGMAPRIANLEGWTLHLGHRLERLARLTGDARLADLLAEIRSYPGVGAALDARRDTPTDELLLTLHFRHSRGDLALVSTVTTFGAANDVTLSELTVESFFPADAAARRLLQHLFDAAGTEAARV